MAETVKLAFEMYRYEHLVFGRCTYLDKDLRGTGLLAENTRCKIMSEDEPGVITEEGKNIVSVWGNTTSKDSEVMLLKFDDVETAQAFAIDLASLCAKVNGAGISMNAPVKVM